MKSDSFCAKEGLYFIAFFFLIKIILAFFILRKLRYFFNFARDTKSTPFVNFFNDFFVKLLSESLVLPTICCFPMKTRYEVNSRIPLTYKSIDINTAARELFQKSIMTFIYLCYADVTYKYYTVPKYSKT